LRKYFKNLGAKKLAKLDSIFRLSKKLVRYQFWVEVTHQLVDESLSGARPAVEQKSKCAKSFLPNCWPIDVFTVYCLEPLDN